MFENDNPRRWEEPYPRMGIYRVHDSIYQIRRCPICTKVIEDYQVEAIKENLERELRKGR